MDMVYVEDLAEILVRALIMEHNCYDSVFEGGTGVSPTVNDIANQIIREVNSKSKLKHVDMRPGEEKLSIVRADIRTLKPLKFNKFIQFNEGIKKTIKWYKNQKLI